MLHGSWVSARTAEVRSSACAVLAAAKSSNGAQFDRPFKCCIAGMETLLFQKRFVDVGEEGHDALLYGESIHGRERMESNVIDTQLIEFGDERELSVRGLANCNSSYVNLMHRNMTIQRDACIVVVVDNEA